MVQSDNELLDLYLKGFSETLKNPDNYNSCNQNIVYQLGCSDAILNIADDCLKRLSNDEILKKIKSEINKNE